MKKVFTILLGMILVISMVGCVCADPTTIMPGNPQDQKGYTEVSYTVAQGYSVIIPESIDIDSDTGYNTISATITKIEPNHLLNITISGGSYDGTSDMWYLTHINDAGNKLGYYINKGVNAPDTTSGSPVDSGNVVLSVPANEKTQQEIQIHCRLVTDVAAITHSGTYTDQLIFTVSIEEDPSTSQPSQ